MDFAHSLRSSRGSGTTPRSSQTSGSPASSFSKGLSISVTPGSSPAQQYRSSPSHAGGAAPRRSSSIASSTGSNVGEYLQRTAISNAYSGRGDDETASTSSESLSILTGGGGGSSGGGGGGVSSPMSVSSRSGSILGERGSNFKVVIRVRPPLPRELHNDRPFQNVIHVDSEGHILTVSENLSALPSGGGDASGGGGGGGGESAAENALAGSYGSHTFSFDHVYDQHCTQRTVYENTAKAVVESSLEGYNATIFAYGQTGTGKTYTMEGFHSGGGGGGGGGSSASAVEERGIIPRAIEQIFLHIQSHMSARMRFLVRASYLQIYNESISDLLKPERSNLTIREDKKRGVFVEGLSEWVVRSPEEIYGLMERGGAMRATGSTKMNELSSRSHAVFIIIAEQSRTSYVDAKGNDISAEEFTGLVNAYQARHGGAAPNNGGGNGGGQHALHPKLESMIRQSFKVGKLNLVDLAGSERVRLSGATGQRLEESKKINQSLSALGNVIAALTDARGRQHIPYRDSKLTRILEDSLGGNCKTTMMAMISPALEAITESLSTLKFANRAKSIKNEARVNEDLDQKSLLRKYERELKRLRAELEEKSRNVVDKRRLLELDEQRRRAEEDKMAAIRALEERSREFMKEKEEKKKLEQRIAMLMSQVLTSNQRRQQHNGGAGPLSGATDVDFGGGDTSIFMENGGAGGAGGTTDDPLIREALKEHHERIRHEYASRLAELEKERESIEEEKAQVDRYKQLLLKQRDIMIALTQRLNERDEQITALQDELDAYDRHQKELEEKLDERTAHLIHLERVTMEQTSSSSNSIGGGVERRGGGEEGTRPELLVSYRQFKPHAASVESAPLLGGVGGGGGATPTLLSAEEKISELGRLLETQSLDQQRLARELEDVKAEKVSVEYLLRERLEKLVQVEMEARVKSMAWSHSQQHQEQLVQLQKKIDALDADNQRLRHATELASNATNQNQQSVLQARCDTLVKERRAVQTIMEQKIKALVGAISEASEATFQSAGGAEQLGEPAKWLAKEVHALQRLVNASIVALRNAEASNQTNNNPTTGKTPASTVDPGVPQGKSTATRTVDLTSSRAPPPAPSPAPSVSSTTSGMSVDELIQQRRAQLQRERQAN